MPALIVAFLPVNMVINLHYVSKFASNRALLAQMSQRQALVNLKPRAGYKPPAISNAKLYAVISARGCNSTCAACQSTKTV
jgi:hypothetical protein